MINGNITDFIDQLYYGQELLFSYNNRNYFIQGWWDKDQNEAVMVLTDESEQTFNGYLWESRRSKMSECAEEFLKASLWDGLDFLQIEKNVIWTEW